MKYKKLLALALVAATTPAFASSFTVDFEKTWDYANGDVNNYYNGGAAAGGSTGGSNLGVSFVNVSGLSNDSLGTYYSNAPSMQGVAYAHDTAYMNVAAGVDNLSFWYSSFAEVADAVTAWSGVNGTGTLLGSFNLTANDSGTTLDTWNSVMFSFTGTAKSFDFTGSANVAAFDNISTVPAPAAAWLYGSGLAMFGAIRLSVRLRSERTADSGQLIL